MTRGRSPTRQEARDLGSRQCGFESHRPHIENFLPRVSWVVLPRATRRYARDRGGSSSPGRDTRRCGGPVAYADCRRGVAVVEPVEADRLAAGIVVQPDAVAEQNRRDVYVDLVDQAEPEKLRTDGGREHPEILAAGRGQRDAYRLGRVTVEESDAVGGRGVFGVVGEHEDRSGPGAAPRAAVAHDPVPAGPAPQYGTRALDVLLDQARTDSESGHPAHLVIRSGHEPVQGHREAPEHLPARGLRLRTAHSLPPAICLRLVG